MNQLRSPIQIVSIFLAAVLTHSTARGVVIDEATGGPTFALAKLVLEGADFGINAANATAGLILNRPWVFMFADRTPALQDFASDVGLPGGVASNTASSAGFLGSAASSGLASAPAKALIPVAVTRGAASANAVAGFGTTFKAAVPFTTALKAHIGTILLDPLAAPDTPISQSPPPDPDIFPVFDPTFVPACVSIDANMLNELGDTFSIFHLKACLGFDSLTGRFDNLNLEVTGPGGAPSSLITESDFSFFDGAAGFGYQLSNLDLDIPYSLPAGWENLTATAALEGRADAASSVALPEPCILALLGLGGLGVLGFRGCRVKQRTVAA